MARVLIPGVLAGVAISLIANIVIGGIFYNLFNNTAVGTLAGTLTASVVGAILGVIAISTANRKGTAVVLRAAAAGALISMAGGFFGSINPEALDGFIENSILLGIAIGVMFGAAGLRGTGMRFASAWVDEDEELGTFGKALDGSFAGMLVGISCALPVVMFYGGILVQMRFRPRVDFVRLVSTDGLLLGAILGITAGILIGLVLSRKRVDGLLNGALVGTVVGIIMALPAITVLTFTELGGIWGDLSRFGTVAIVILGGVAIGATMPGASFAGRYHGALIGIAIGIANALPYMLLRSLISSYSIGGEQGLSVKHSFRALWESGAYGSLIISIIVGAAIGLITDGLMRRSVGASIGNSAVCVAAIATALGMQGGDFLFFLNIFLYRSGIELPHILFKDQFVITLLLKLVIGVAIGALVGVVVVRLAARQPRP